MSARVRLQLLALAAAGGALGALARWGVGVVLPTGPPVGLPVGTLLVNLAGCLALGLLVGARPSSAGLHAFAGTGVCGGFTTFSAFAVEADTLLAERPAIAAAYLFASLAGGTALAGAGLRLGRRVGMPASVRTADGR